jgi:hypothetical protein
MRHAEPIYNPFAKNAHDKAQDAIDHAREVREKRIAERGKPTELPRLIVDGMLRRCSACGYTFPADIHPSMSIAFTEHLRKQHAP